MVCFPGPFSGAFAMSNVHIRQDIYQRLEVRAGKRSMSVDALVEEITTSALTDLDDEVETDPRVIAGRKAAFERFVRECSVSGATLDDDRESIYREREDAQMPPRDGAV